MSFVRVKQEHQPIVVYGYIRNHYQQFFPEDVINTILLFFATRIVWTVTNDEISKLKQSKSKLKGPSFIIDGIKLELSFGHNFYYKHVPFQVDIKSVPLNIATTRMKLILSCKQANIEWRKMITIDSLYQLQTIAWDYKMLSMNDASKYNKLKLECCVDLLSMTYKSGYDKSSFIKPIAITPYYQQIKFEWNIKDETLKQLKQDKCTIYLWSDYFGVGDNFCLSLHKDQMKVILGLHVVSLPYYLKDITMKYEMEIFGDDIEFYAKFQDETAIKDTFFVGTCIMEISDLLPLESLVIDAELQRIHK